MSSRHRNLDLEGRRFRLSGGARQWTDELYQATALAALALLMLLGTCRRRSRTGMRADRAADQAADSRTLQHSLLPRELPVLPGVDLTARYLPANSGAIVGGDWYDAFLLPDGRLALAIGDVVGHDLQAAGVMGTTRSVLRAYALEGYEPTEVLSRLNHCFLQLYPASMVTCVYGLLSPESRSFTWANAGHCPPLLVRAGLPAEYLPTEPSAPPVGVATETRYLDVTVLLPPGSRLLFFTDGLVERRDVDIDVGLRLLAESAARARPGVEALCDAALAACIPGGVASDDVALLAVALDAERAASGDQSRAGTRVAQPKPDRANA